jgi:hypothetical protein
MERRVRVDVSKMVEDELLEQRRAAHEAPTKPPVESLNIEIDDFSLEPVEPAPSTRPTPAEIREELLAKSDPRREPHVNETQPPPPGYSPADLGDDPSLKR